MHGKRGCDKNEDTDVSDMVGNQIIAIVSLCQMICLKNVVAGAL